MSFGFPQNTAELVMLPTLPFFFPPPVFQKSELAAGAMTKKLGTVCVSLWLPALLLLCRHPQASYRAFLSPLSCSSRRERREQRAWSAKPNKARHNQSFLRQEHGFVETLSRSLNDWGWQQLPGWFGSANKEGNRYGDIFFSSWTRSMRRQRAGNSQRSAHHAAPPPPRFPPPSHLPTGTLPLPPLSQSRLLLSAFSPSSANTLQLGRKDCSLQNVIPLREQRARGTRNCSPSRLEECPKYCQK